MFTAARTNMGLNLLVHSWVSSELTEKRALAQEAVTYLLSDLPCSDKNADLQRQDYANRKMVGLAYLAAGQEAQALTHFCSDPYIAEEFIVKALGLEKSGAHEKASGWATIARKIYPDIPNVPFDGFADNAFAIKDLPQAIGWLDISTSYQPDNGLAWNRLAYYTQLMMRWHPETIDDFNPYYQKYLVYNKQDLIINNTFTFGMLGWQKSQQTNTGNEFGITADSVYIKGTSPGDYAGLLQILILPANQRVTYTARIATKGDDYFVVRPLYWEHVDQGIHGHESQIEISGTTEWTTYAVTFEIPESEQGIALYPVRFSGVGTVWIDDVSLVLSQS
ncbi:MAG: hypothetical protein R2932_49000 [Caldilineaceae bacterium]